MVPGSDDEDVRQIGRPKRGGKIYDARRTTCDGTDEHLANTASKTQLRSWSRVRLNDGK